MRRSSAYSYGYGLGRQFGKFGLDADPDDAGITGSTKGRGGVMGRFTDHELQGAGGGKGTVVPSGNRFKAKNANGLSSFFDTREAAQHWIETGQFPKK